MCRRAISPLGRCRSFVSYDLRIGMAVAFALGFLQSLCNIDTSGVIQIFKALSVSFFLRCGKDGLGNSAHGQ